MDINIIRDKLTKMIYLEEELKEPGIIDSIKNSIEVGLHQTAINTWNWFLNSINNSIDGVALITIMVTWMLHMMSVPNAGKWCYITFAVYIVLKILIKCFSMI